MSRYPSITDRNLSEGFQELLYYANQVTDNWFSSLILIGVFVITSMGVLAAKKDAFEGFAVGSFLTLLVAILFFWAKFIGGITLSFVIAIAIISFTLLWTNKKSD